MNLPADAKESDHGEQKGSVWYDNEGDMLEVLWAFRDRVLHTHRRWSSLDDDGEVIGVLIEMSTLKQLAPFEFELALKRRPMIRHGSGGHSVNGRIGDEGCGSAALRGATKHGSRGQADSRTRRLRARGPVARHRWGGRGLSTTLSSRCTERSEAVTRNAHSRLKCGISQGLATADRVLLRALAGGFLSQSITGLSGAALTTGDSRPSSKARSRYLPSSRKPLLGRLFCHAGGEETMGSSMAGAFILTAYASRPSRRTKAIQCTMASRIALQPNPGGTPKVAPTCSLS